MLPLQRLLQTVWMIEALLLGLSVGLLAVMSPGPITLALVEIGSSRGRGPGLRAGAGVAGADVLMSALALGLVLAGAGLPPSVLSGAQVLSSLFLVTVGIGLLTRPDVARSLVGQLTHPCRSMFATTALNPAVFGAWVAIFTAMPFSQDAERLLIFGGGGIVVSILWHIGLGGAAGSLGAALTEGRRTSLARIGGIGMLAFATWAML